MRTGAAANFEVDGSKDVIAMAAGDPGPATPTSPMTTPISPSTSVWIRAPQWRPIRPGRAPGDVERGDGYHADLRYLGSGAVQVQLMKRVSGGETVITTTTMSGLTVAAGDGLDVRVQAFGSSPTTLRAKV